MSVPRRRPAARTHIGLRLGVLLVLAGVLAMHAMGGGSHMAMVGTPQAGSRLTLSVPGVERMATDVMAMPGLTGAPTSGVARIDSVSAPAAAAAAPAIALDPGVAAACVAVLLGLVLLAARAAVGVPRPPHPPTSVSGGHSSAPLGRGPPRQLLAQICVLRT